MLDLIPFQRRFLRRALRPGIRTAALSIPRGNGKSSLAAWLASRALTPGDRLFVRGAESHLAAASIGQSRRSTFKLLREFIEAAPNVDDYRIAESPLACHVVHKPTNTRCSVLASSGKTAQGLVRCPWLIADEPGAWEINGGQLLYDAIVTAQGKPGSRLRAVFIGTVAPARTGWWPDLLDDGSHGSIVVVHLAGDPDKWDRWPEIRRVNPLMARFPESRAVLLEERDKARSDPRRKAQFLSYRLNVPTADQSKAVLTVDDWQRTKGREVPAADGRPLVGVDLGQSRAWSSAVAVWPNGRVEAVAVAPGIPTIEAQERRDRVSRTTYQRLVDAGLVIVADDARVPSPGLLMEHVALRWSPRYVLCDYFRVPELRDHTPAGVRIVPRRPLWSTGTADVRALRRMAADGPLAVDRESLPLVEASLAVSVVKNDDAGNHRLTKNTNNTSRDDVTAALLLAAGAASRTRPRGPAKFAIAG